MAKTYLFFGYASLTPRYRTMQLFLYALTRRHLLLSKLSYI